MAKDLFKRYIWLIDTIYRAKKITLKEIKEKWLRYDSENEPIPTRTFHNHRSAIEDFFDIVIECDKSQNAYYIEDKEQLSGSVAKNWLLNTLTVSNLVNESHKLKNRILFEYIPSGQQYLTSIIEAMRENLTLWVSYQSFIQEKAHEFEIAPYALKIFKQRWYVLANSTAEDKLRIYALDRLQCVETTKATFKLPKDFDAETYFSDCFGIIAMDEQKPETIKIKVSAYQANYLRSLPLHHSQTEERKEEYSIFTYKLKASYDFRQEILKYGSDIEVLSPEWLREEIAETVSIMCKCYDVK
jgi:hypothetical protein